MTKKGVTIRLRCTGRVVAQIPDIRLMRDVMIRVMHPLTVVGPGPW
jgi:hypothetical protein